VRKPLSVVGGSVVFDFAGRRVDVYGADRGALEPLRWSHLSCILQGSMNVLNPLRRIRHSFVDFAFRHVGKSMREFIEIVRAHLRRLHLEPAILEAYPHQLSGGMRQRVTIALATVCWPQFIIADEPTTALDVVVQKSVLAMIRDAQRQIGSSMIFVTHDLAVHANLCDRLGIMYAGRLVEEAPTADIFRAPRHPYTRHLIASLPRLGAAAARASLDGAPPNLADPPRGCRFHPRCPLAMDVCRRDTPPMIAVAPAHRVACFATAGGAPP
jgi:peptide/nickel transport system ATP-binding protein